jgi:hypothetical protein
MKAVFPVLWFVARVYNVSPLAAKSVSRVDAGSNTSTVALRVVGGDGKENLESETVKYGHESYGSRTRK